MPTSELVSQAYRLLKQDSYFDKMDLFLRARIASYETGDDFALRQLQVVHVVEALRLGVLTASIDSLEEWLAKVDYRILPKSIKGSHHNHDDNRTKGASFISNVRTSEKYLVQENGGVQYFIDAPVELYILSTIWCLVVGPAIERTLDVGCFGNRLAPHDPSKLFKIFHNQYTEWRDTAIERAEELLERGTSTVLVSLDIKQYYYNLYVDWNAVPVNSEDEQLSRGLTRILQHTHAKYRQNISSMLEASHGDVDVTLPEGIPIGLPSSRVLSNWLLTPFDVLLRETLQPTYYGRYVDDMLVVVQSPANKVVELGAKAVLYKIFVERQILEERDDDYVLSMPGQELVVQGRKLHVQHFDKNHSRAGLREFSEQVKREASDFRFLPADDRGRELDACAYDIIYDGSINKLRSVIGVRENSTELSKYLARRMVEHRLTAESLNTGISEQLERFCLGKNLLDFFTTWERILTLLIAKGQEPRAAEVLNKCLRTIQKICSEHPRTDPCVAKAKLDLVEYLALALSLPLALLDQSALDDLRSRRLNKLIEGRFPQAIEMARTFRRSNMLRHQWVFWPLINYTSFQGSLLASSRGSLRQLKNCDWTIGYAEALSPRHIHCDERQLFAILKLMSTNGAWEELPKPNGLDSAAGDSDLGIPRLDSKSFSRNPGTLTLGVANLHVSPADISASYEPLRLPNRSWARQSRLFHLLNLAEKEDCEMLVLPEVSVPYSWLPFMVAHARHSQIALVFGLEHWVSDKVAYNLLVTVLPYKEEKGYRACEVFVRPKNYYSPAETHELARLDLTPSTHDPFYYLLTWRGTRFAVFNCYELSNIKHRATMRANVDLVVAVEWNRDVRYFSNIVESTVRDLHCYVVQVNTSQYGDSRVTSPKKTDDMDYVRVKGGLNTTLLKAKIDIQALNDFRSKRPSAGDKAFKPTSAGFEHDVIREDVPPRRDS
jgi:hypothetical protein